MRITPINSAAPAKSYIRWTDRRSVSFETMVDEYSRKIQAHAFSPVDNGKIEA